MPLPSLRDVRCAEYRFQFAREACLSGQTELATECLVDIGAFYERAKLSGRARACESALNRLLAADPLT